MNNSELVRIQTNPLLLQDMVQNIAVYLQPKELVRFTQALEPSLNDIFWKKACERDFAAVPAHISPKQHYTISEMNQYKDQWMVATKKILDRVKPVFCLVAETEVYYNILSLLVLEDYDFKTNLLLFVSVLLNKVDDDPIQLTCNYIFSLFYLIAIWSKCSSDGENQCPISLVQNCPATIKGFNDYQVFNLKNILLLAGFLIIPYINNICVKINSKSIDYIVSEAQNKSSIAVGEIASKLREAKDDRYSFLENVYSIPARVIRAIPSETLNMAKNAIQGISGLFLSKTCNPKLSS